MIIIGHRGARGLAPENTLASFEKALEFGVDEIELDVRVTEDGLTAIIHDPYLIDRAGNRLKISDHTFAELQNHKPDLIALDTAISFINRRVPMLIEVKPKVPTKQTVKILQSFLAAGWKTDDFLLGSFDQRVLVALHNDLPNIKKVVIERWSGVRAHFRAKQLSTKRLNMRSWWLWSGFIRSMSDRGYQISPYTLNDPAKAKKWAKHGLYGVITDYPDRFEK